MFGKKNIREQLKEGKDHWLAPKYAEVSSKCSMGFISCNLNKSGPGLVQPYTFMISFLPVPSASQKQPSPGVTDFKQGYLITGKNANPQNRKGHGHPCIEKEPWRDDLGKQDFLIHSESLSPSQCSAHISDGTLQPKWAVWREKQGGQDEGQVF